MYSFTIKYQAIVSWKNLPKYIYAGNIFYYFKTKVVVYELDCIIDTDTDTDR